MSSCFCLRMLFNRNYSLIKCRTEGRMIWDGLWDLRE